jgi:hypothetical protein
VNSQILTARGQGDIHPKPDVKELRGRAVGFKDGTAEPIDLIIYATGYRVCFPFLAAEHSSLTNGAPDFYLHLFDRAHDDLFIVGMLQPDGGVWPLMDLQARAVARYLEALRAKSARLEKVRALKRERPDLGGGIRYIPSERHRFEVEHSTYRRRLRKVIRLLGS